MKGLKIVLISFLLIILIFLGIDKKLKKDITIIDNDKVLKVRTFEKRLSDLLNAYNFRLGDYDHLSMSEDGFLRDNMTIEIKRAFPVKIQADGKIIETMSTDLLVKELLRRENIKLNSKDKVYPGINNYVEKDKIIKVLRVEEKEITRIEKVPYQKIIKLRPDLKLGTVKTINQGKIGENKVTYKITFEEGKEVSKEIVDTKVIEPVKNQIIHQGFEQLYVSSRGIPLRYKEIIILEATAYDLSYQSTGKLPTDEGYGITYSGTLAHSGVVAVDPKVIPLGSKLYIESLDDTKDYGYASAEDTGSDIKGNRIDLFISDHDKAMQYGRRNVKVYVLKDDVPNSKINGYSGKEIYD